MNPILLNFIRTGKRFFRLESSNRLHPSFKPNDKGDIIIQVYESRNSRYPLSIKLMNTPQGDRLSGIFFSPEFSNIGEGDLKDTKDGFLFIDQHDIIEIFIFKGAKWNMQELMKQYGAGTLDDVLEDARREAKPFNPDSIAA